MIQENTDSEELWFEAAKLFTRTKQSEELLLKEMKLIIDCLSTPNSNVQANWGTILNNSLQRKEMALNDYPLTLWLLSFYANHAKYFTWILQHSPTDYRLEFDWSGDGKKINVWSSSWFSDSVPRRDYWYFWCNIDLKTWQFWKYHQTPSHNQRPSNPIKVLNLQSNPYHANVYQK